MKKILIGIGIVGGAAAIFLSVMATRYESVIRPNISVGTVSVSGLTLEEAKKKLRAWWETERRNQITLANPSLVREVPPRTASAWGILLDDEATIGQVGVDDFWDSLGRQVGINDAPTKKLDPIFRFERSRVEHVIKKIAEFGQTERPATVSYQGGVVRRLSETAGVELDLTKLSDAVLLAIHNGGTGDLPLIEAAKRVDDDALATITDVIGTFSTNFSNGKVARCANIKLSSSKLSGMVLMPGERLSFNDHLGRRTIAGGYRVAPVIKNGRHDFDVGGGLCQVSTTLYNAVLLANLKVVGRNNHSLPSAYVPLGRDATVDYGSRDLVFENSAAAPIAIVSKYEPGKLTYYVLGTREPGLSVRIVTEGARRWSRGTKIVHDGSLPPGKRKVIDSGGSAASISTYRIVMKNGQQVKKELLNRSAYAGAPKIIAVNTRPAPAQTTPVPMAGTAPTLPPDAPLPIPDP